MLHTEQRETQRSTQKNGRSETILARLFLATFSLLYFAEVFIRASQKYFWYDELFTLYLSRLPTIGTLLTALGKGADFTPPLFFLVTKASATIFGYGLIGVRLPEILGFWVLCLCLFRFVRRRVGLAGGLISMLFPMLTGAFYYSFEARPYGLVLGLCGLALIFWQNVIEDRNRRWSLIAFGVFLFTAFMLHCYALLIAVPFTAAELVRAFHTRRVDWPVWIIIVGCGSVAAFSYLPLLLAYGAVAHGTDFQSIFPASIIQIPNSYLFLLGPCATLVVVSLVLLCVDRITSVYTRPSALEPNGNLLPEVILLAAFAALPILGVIAARILGAPFFARYFLSTTIGICALFGLGVGTRRCSNWVAITLAALMISTATWHLSALVWHRIRGQEDALAEPSTGLSMNFSSKGPLLHYSSFLSDAGDSLPIAVLEPQDFLYLVNYAPRLVPRLYLVRPSQDIFYRGFKILQPWCPVSYNAATTYDAFLRSNSDFLAFGADQIFELALMNQRGGKITSFRVLERRFLAEVQFAAKDQNRPVLNPY